jgi:DNA-binding response OmpR family regulator
MLKLVNALLDFSRIEASERTGAFCLTDLGQLTTDVAAMFTATAGRAGLALTVDCPPFSAPVYVDREAWERIVSNLLSNALKFTLEGRIDVRTREEQGWAELAVADTGIGITADDLDQVFSRFHRVGDPRARTQEGTGIGLALVRELVELHDGSVEARSQPGRGTEMIVRIPLAGERLCDRTPPEDAPGPLLGSSARLFIAEADGWLDGRTPAPAPDSLPGGLTTKPTAPSRRGDVDSVLVVEDNVDMQGYLRRLLGPHYTVQVAQDGRQGCELALRHRPRLVISDVMMPGLDGLGLLRELRRNPRTREAPVMLVSALADGGSAEQAFRLGADDYIVKPFSARELLARVAAAIESAGVRSRAAAARGRAAERGRAQRELGAVLNDLRAAQRRAVIAADAERRRIERDLHDGAQQRLMAIRLELGLIVEALEHDREGARAKLGALRAELDEALEEVRELAHGLYPPLLASDGLYAALSAAARRAAIPIAIETTELARAPRAIESAAYFCCLEALQNAATPAPAPGRRWTSA